MGDSTGISWTDATWNPVRGCSRVSPGCQHCYAEVQAARIVRMGKGKPTAYDGLVKVTAGGEARWTGEVRLVPEQLAWPLRKRKPLRIFVNSMSDLFHEKLTNEQIAAVFGVMAACPQHTFQVLTKRARRMREWFEWVARNADSMHENMAGWTRAALCWCETNEVLREHDVPSVANCDWPLPNVWLGVSVENQDAADERIPELLRTPAAVRFLSCEPLLGPVNVERWTHRCASCVCSSCPPGFDDDTRMGQDRLSWIIAGCESGLGARPCSVEWLRSLRDQCAAAGVPFFLKQAEAIPNAATMVPQRTPLDDAYVGDSPRMGVFIPTVAAASGSSRKPGGVIELPYLDGVQHAEFPR